MQELDEARIRQRAFELSEQAGHPEGQDQHFWYAARIELLAEDQADQLAGERPATTAV